MFPICRLCRDESDYYKIREFLCLTLLFHDRKEINRPLYRWDYWRWHPGPDGFGKMGQFAYFEYSYDLCFAKSFSETGNEVTIMSGV